MPDSERGIVFFEPGQSVDIRRTGGDISFISEPRVLGDLGEGVLVGHTHEFPHDEPHTMMGVAITPEESRVVYTLFGEPKDFFTLTVHLINPGEIGRVKCVVDLPSAASGYYRQLESEGELDEEGDLQFPEWKMGGSKVSLVSPANSDILSQLTFTFEPLAA